MYRGKTKNGTKNKCIRLRSWQQHEFYRVKDHVLFWANVFRNASRRRTPTGDERSAPGERRTRGVEKKRSKRPWDPVHLYKQPRLEKANILL